jgi:hypothetical protein
MSGMILEDVAFELTSQSYTFAAICMLYVCDGRSRRAELLLRTELVSFPEASISPMQLDSTSRLLHAALPSTLVTRNAPVNSCPTYASREILLSSVLGSAVNVEP